MNDPPPGNTADELLTALRGQALAEEAADYLAGRRWLTVWHGDLESADDVRRVEALASESAELASRWPGCVIRRQGGNDYSATLFGAVAGVPSPDQLADTLATFAAGIAPTHPALGARTWWRIVRADPAAGSPLRDAR